MVPVEMRAWLALGEKSGTQTVVKSPHRTLELQSCVLVHYMCAWLIPQLQLSSSNRQYTEIQISSANTSNFWNGPG